MPVDTKQNRMSALSPSLPFRGPLVDAGELGFNKGNRQAAGFHYSGIGATNLSTKQRRMSALLPSLPFRGPLVDAAESGTALTQGNRQAAAYAYSGVEAHRLNVGLVANWQENGSGNLVDAKTSQALAPVGSPTSAEGRPGTGLVTDFNKWCQTTQSVASANGWLLGTSDFSVSCWVYPTDLAAGNRYLFATNGTTGANIGFAILALDDTNEDGKSDVHVTMRDNTTTSIGKTFSGNGHVQLTENAWNHVAVTVDRAGVIKLYINAAKHNEEQDATGHPGTLDGGHNWYWSGRFDGTFSNCMLWHRVLTAQEVNVLYNGGFGLQYPFNDFSAQRIDFDIPGALLGNEGFHRIFPRMTAKQAARLCAAQGLLSAAGAAALPGAIDEDYYDAAGNVWGKLLADGGLCVMEVSNWSGTWVEETHNNLDWRIWYGDWIPSGTTAIELREQVMTAYGDTGAEALAVLRALSDTEIQALLWTTPRSATGGAYTDVVKIVCGIAPFQIDVHAKPIAANALNKPPTPGNTLSTAAANQVQADAGEYTFVAGDVGKVIVKAAQTNWNAGTYRITGVAGGVATLDANITSAHPQTSGAWFMRHYDWPGEGFIMRAEAAHAQGTNVSYAGVEGPPPTYKITDAAARWKTGLDIHSHLPLAPTTNALIRDLVLLTTPAKTVMAVWDGDYGAGGTGQYNAGIWLDKWKASVVDAGPATEDNFDAPGSKLKKFINNLAALYSPGDGPDYIFFDSELNPSANTFLAGAAPAANTNAAAQRNFGITTGGLGHTKPIASIADDPAEPGQNVIVTLDNNRIPHLDGTGGGITQIVDGGGGQIAVTTSGSHGMIAGDPVVITGTTDYNGRYIVASATSNTFNVAAIYVADELAGSWTNSTMMDTGDPATTIQAQQFFTFENVTGTTALNGTHRVEYDGVLNPVLSTTIRVMGVSFNGSVENDDAICYGTHAPMQDARWGVAEPSLSMIQALGNELDSFDIKQGAAGSWREHTSGVNRFADERAAVFSGIIKDYFLETWGKVEEFVASTFPSTAASGYRDHLASEYRYNLFAAGIFPVANGFNLGSVLYSKMPRINGVRAAQIRYATAAAQSVHSRKDRLLKQPQYNGMDAQAWNALLFHWSGWHSVAACSTVPQVSWYLDRRAADSFDPESDSQDKYYEWFIRMLWLSGTYPMLWHIVGELTLPHQDQIDLQVAAINNAVTRMGGSDHKGLVLADPHNADLYNADGPKFIRMCADVGGKFLNIVLVRPDEYDGGNFVSDGAGGVNVVDKAGTTVLVNIPNASVTEELDPGAWITQTAL